MAANWSIQQATCDYCGRGLTVLRVGHKLYSEWRYPADGWAGAEGHEAYHRAIEGELREAVRKGSAGR
jgi:hypothetical protein